MAVEYSIVYSHQCPVNRNLGCFQAFAIANNVTTCNLVYLLLSAYYT